MTLRLRQAVRAVVLDPAGWILLVRFEFPRRALWAAPGGGIEPGEEPADALRRELAEEVGLTDVEIGPEIWTRTHFFPFIDGSHDGQTESFYLVETERFEPRPQVPWEELAREYLTAMRWWSTDELVSANARFAPRRMARLVTDILRDGPPPTPIDAGV